MPDSFPVKEPSLEFLRKEAKALLKLCRAGESQRRDVRGISPRLGGTWKPHCT